MARRGRRWWWWWRWLFGGSGGDGLDGMVVNMWEMEGWSYRIESFIW